MTIHKRTLTRILFFTVLLGVLLFTAGVLRAQISTRSGDLVDAGETLADMAFFSAGDLNVSARSTDDIFAAGGDVSLNGAQADHMIAAGGDVIITDVAFQDLVVAGGDINFVSGVVADDVVAAGGDLKIDRNFIIRGSAMLGGGEISIDAPIGDELRAAGGRLRVRADVGGNARLVGDEIMVGPDVTIGGDLHYRAKQFTLDPSALVEGDIIELEKADAPDFEGWGMKAVAAIAVFAIAFLVGMAILVVITALVLPGLMQSASQMIRTRPLSALGLGFLILAAAPVVIALLFASVIGIPLALLVIAIYLAAAPVAIAAFSYFAGMAARRAISKSETAQPGPLSRVGWSGLAAIVLLIIALIPIAGGFILLVAYTIGMGAVMTQGGKALAMTQASRD